MDNRLYFTLGDIAACMVTGAVVASLIGLIVSPAWNMFVAMFVSMALGMVFGLPLSLPFSYFFGAIEIMVPTMMTGMFSGMVVGMSAAMGPVSFSATSMIGAVVGLVTINGVWLATQKLRGPQRLPDAGQPNE